jgi:protein involved in polysaccharide export with SLBB domain
VYILGEVMMPGQFVMKKEMYVTDLIALSMGFNDVASSVGYLYRRKPDANSLPAGEAPTDEAITIDFKALGDGRKPELNMRLRGGDVLYVPQEPKRYIYVVGDVRRAGAFRIEGKDMLASRALSLAGGALRTAKMSQGVLVRMEANGSLQELPVDFDAILRGYKPDIAMRPDDIVFIPGSTAKSLTYATLGLLPSMLTQRAADAAVR